MPQPRQHASSAARQLAYRTRCGQRAANHLAKPAPSRPVRLSAKPGHRRWNVMLKQAQDAISAIADEMESYYDDHSDEWRDGERGEAFKERYEAVQGIAEQFDELPEP